MWTVENRIVRVVSTDRAESDARVVRANDSGGIGHVVAHYRNILRRQGMEIAAESRDTTAATLRHGGRCHSIVRASDR